jgi:hypothetical protein
MKYRTVNRAMQSFCTIRCRTFIPPISPQSPSPVIRGWYNRPVSGRSTQSPTPLIKKTTECLLCSPYYIIVRQISKIYKFKRLVAGFPPRRPGFKPGSSHVGFVVGKVALGQVGFLRVLRFPMPIFIPPISPQSPSPIIRGWYNRPVVAAVLKKSHRTN